MPGTTRSGAKRTSLDPAFDVHPLPEAINQ
jgi:hypothetical protein